MTPSEPDWERLSFPVSRDSIAAHSKDEDWQILRNSIKGASLHLKYEALSIWLQRAKNVPDLERRKVQVGNYVNALRRGGFIPRKKS